MDGSIDESRAYWDRHARQDPMWAVLSDPAKKGRKWDLRDFMADGEREIALLMHQLARLGLDPGRGAALDFGCGIGRLTQALARRFDRVTGIDISSEMVLLAQQINRYPSVAEYLTSGDPDLRSVPSRSCELVYSNIVLQHVNPETAVAYLHAFFRVLKPGGVLVFQLPSHQEPLSDGAIRPMPADAYDARIELTAPAVAHPAGFELLTDARITNVSRCEWRQRDFGSIQVGNHWFDGTGRFMVTQDDGRAVLPQSMKPGESCNVSLKMTVPSAPGKYQGEVDVVHEGVTWFRDKGSAVVRFPIEVTSAAPAATPRPINSIDELPIPDYSSGLAGLDGDGTVAEGIEPFPMHGVPRAEVLAIVSHHGATLVHVEDGLRAGAEWVDYRYFIRTRA